MIESSPGNHKTETISLYNIFNHVLRLNLYVEIHSLQKLHVHQVYQFCAFLIGRWQNKVLERLELIYIFARAQSVHKTLHDRL